MSILRATIKVTRLFGVFPLHFLQSGPITFKWASLTTILSLAKALLYSVSTFDYICLAYYSNEVGEVRLSEQLVFYPHLLAMIASDLVIHVASASNSINVAKLIRILDSLPNYQHHNPIDPGARLLYAGLLLYALSSVCHMVGNLASISHGVSSLFFCHGDCSGGDFISWLYALINISHDGTVFSAMAFLAIFGVRLARVFQEVSETLHKYCVGGKVEFFHEFQGCLNLFGARGGKLGCARMFVKQYLELRRSFEVYSRVAAMTIVVLIVEVYAVLFCFVGAWFVYYKELPPSAFTQLSIYICTSVSIIILLIELGQYMDTKVR